VHACDVEDVSAAQTPSRRITTAVVTIAVIASLATSLLLLVKHDVYSGPGDELRYYPQAERLIPFEDHFYGPGYFVALRVVHDLFQADWFLAGKLVGWFSACFVLMMTWEICRRVLGRESAKLATALVALNPVFIGQSYSSLTIMYGATWSLLAIWAMLVNQRNRATSWLGCGLLFGLANLTRFQNNGFLLGAIAGMLILPGLRWPKRLGCAALLVVGGAIPPLLWNGYLHAVQGFVPKDLNYNALTVALGEWKDFFDTQRMIDKYGSTLDILTAHWSNPFRIVAYGLKQAVKFPFGVAFGLLFLGAGWLCPGLVAVAERRRLHGPWLGAFLVGLFLTGLGSLGWLHYYVVFLPFCAILIALAIEGADGPPRWPLGRGWLAWALILGSTALWSPVQVWDFFQGTNWVEYKPARAFLEQHKEPHMLVCATAGSISYGASFAFVDQSRIIRAEQTQDLVSVLQSHKVTHLVVTERHTLFEYPELAVLLEDQPKLIPPGLRRELLITSPRRLAIYRVLKP